MERPQISRRALLAGAAATGAGLAAVSDAQASPAPPAEPPPADAAAALERLRAGNRRFVEGKTRHAHESADWRKVLAAGQHPFATVLGCSDSRVPPELVFDQGFGDLFVVRVAGNVVAPDVFGSLEYAVAHLKTRLIVVLGHEGCGAVTAAVDGMFRGSRDLPGIEALLKLIEPGLKGLDASQPRDRQIASGVEANVRWSARQLVDSPEGRQATAKGDLTVVRAVYELATGRVRFLTD